jgi:inner membrane protein
MDLVTHALVSGALARAGVNRATRWATPIALLAGTAPDLDLLSRSGGAENYLAWHRTALHSLTGASVLALAIAFGSWALGRRHPANPVRLPGALIAAASGAALHVLLDLANNRGVRLLWPFSEKWYAWDLIDVIDPWVIALVVLGLLLPGLFRLVTQEIGARPARHGAQRGAIVALALLAVYFGARVWLHTRANAILNSHLYRGAAPLAANAFPAATSPFVWYGVVETENTLEEVEVHLGPGAYFAPDRGRTNFKPDPVPALEAARMTESVELFLRYARFPHATVVRLQQGFRIELRDLRFAAALPRRPGVMATVVVDDEMKVLSQELKFEPRALLR